MQRTVENRPLLSSRPSAAADLSRYAAGLLGWAQPENYPNY
jgi:hypothetical protein